MDSSKEEPSLVTQRDVARALGISDSTVSRALKNNPKISPEIRRKIQEAAIAMGYQMNPMAAALSHYRDTRAKSTVNAALAWINSWPEPERLRKYKEFDAYWNGAEQCARKYGYRLEEFIVNEKMPLKRLRQILLARNVQGVLIPPRWAQSPPISWEDLHFESFSAVRFGQSNKLNLISVGSDQAAAGALAFKKMTERGYKRIGLVVYPRSETTFGAGFLWEQALHIPEPLRVPPFCQSLYENVEEAEALFAKWVKKYKPDAIFTDYVMMADLLKKMGYQLPQDIGLASTSVYDCNITAGIDQNPEEIGRVAVLASISLINDNARGIPPIVRNVLVEGKWVDGPTLPGR